MTAWGAPLLSSRQLFRAIGREAVEDELRRVYGVRGVEFVDPERPSAVLANRVQLDSVTLHYCRYDAEAEIRFGEMAGLRLLTPLMGRGQVVSGAARLDLTPRQAVVTAPGCAFTATYGVSSPYAQLVIQVDEAALARKAALLLGSDHDAVAVGRLRPVPDAALRRLRAVGLALAEQFSAGSSPNPFVVTELEQAMLSAFVAAGLDDEEEPAPSAAPDLLRRLEEFLNSAWDQPLTVEAIATACGASVRSVFAQFRKARGQTPMAYLRDLRLDRARRMLEAIDGSSVIDVALHCGFASLGHFARRYRERFGELPSETRAGRPRN